MKFADFFEAMATACIDYVVVGGWRFRSTMQLRDAAPPAP